MSLKICNKCQMVKPIKEFSRNSSSPDGFRTNCKPCARLWREENKDYIKALAKEYNLINADKIKQKRKDQSGYHRDRNTKWRQSNKARLRARTRQYENQRKITDPAFKLKKTLRTRLNRALKGEFKTGSSVELLGCSIQILKQHLESLFTEGMFWSNHGKWHIDHIKPLSKFDLTNPEELSKACHYTNLQPLWASDNIRKNNKYDIQTLLCQHVN